MGDAQPKWEINQFDGAPLTSRKLSLCRIAA
jgi:hypothetical protein